MQPHLAASRNRSRCAEPAPPLCAAPEAAAWRRSATTAVAAVGAAEAYAPVQWQATPKGGPHVSDFNVPEIRLLTEMGACSAACGRRLRNPSSLGKERVAS